MSKYEDAKVNYFDLRKVIETQIERECFAKLFAGCCPECLAELFAECCFEGEDPHVTDDSGRFLTREEVYQKLLHDYIN